MRPDRQIEPVDLKTIGVAIKAGLLQERAERLLFKYGARALDDALAIMSERQLRRNMEPIRLPEKYLVTILQSGQFGAQKTSNTRTSIVFDTKAERMKLIERFMVQKRAELYAMFHEMSAEEQQKWITKFEEEAVPVSGVIRKTYQSKGISSPIVRQVFFKYLGNSIWEDGWEKPTDVELLDLAILSKNEKQEFDSSQQVKRALIGG
jgi:hypothetical protein